MKFSANLGFLWTDLPLPEAIHAAKSAGFDAVECHFPYDVPATEIKRALEETGLKMLSLNTRTGVDEGGELGFAAIPQREIVARATIDEALKFASFIGASSVHVMAGVASGRRAQDTFCQNLQYACDKAAQVGIDILIEPLNVYDAPGYFLNSSQKAAEIIGKVDRANLKLMFDCYHVQIMEGDLTRRLKALFPLIGHVQFASVPDRGPPDKGEINYVHIFRTLADLGYSLPLGAEYRPGKNTFESLKWMSSFR